MSHPFFWGEGGAVFVLKEQINMTASRSTQIRIYIYNFFFFFLGGEGISDAQIGLLSKEARRSMHMEIFVHFLRYVFVLVFPSNKSFVLSCNLLVHSPVPNNNWSPTGMSTLTHPLQHISGKDHDRRLRRS